MSKKLLNLVTNVSFDDKTVEFTILYRKMILQNINPLQNMNIGEIVPLNYNTLNWKKEEKDKLRIWKWMKISDLYEVRKYGNWS